MHWPNSKYMRTFPPGDEDLDHAADHPRGRRAAGRFHLLARPAGAGRPAGHTVQALEVRDARVADVEDARERHAPPHGQLTAIEIGRARQTGRECCGQAQPAQGS